MLLILRVQEPHLEKQYSKSYNRSTAIFKIFIHLTNPTLNNILFCLMQLQFFLSSCTKKFCVCLLRLSLVFLGFFCFCSCFFSWRHNHLRKFWRSPSLFTTITFWEHPQHIIYPASENNHQFYGIYQMPRTLLDILT